MIYMLFNSLINVTNLAEDNLDTSFQEQHKINDTKYNSSNQSPIQTKSNKTKQNRCAERHKVDPCGNLLNAWA